MRNLIDTALKRAAVDAERVTKETKGSTSPASSSGEPLPGKLLNITVMGCGGAGNNTINRMSEIGIEGARLIALNTDAQDLAKVRADTKILIGKELTKGLGAGANPRIGEDAARETDEEIKSALSGADLVFVTCGLGGGTGTGSAPVVAELAKRAGALTVGIVTLPFTLEGYDRQVNARGGLDKLEKNVDTLIVVPNDKLLEIAPNIPIQAAFKIADEVLVNAVKGITELVTRPGLINRDFADIRAVMSDGGLALIGMGESNTESRAEDAMRNAVNNPLLDIDISGAKRALVNVYGGPDLSLNESTRMVAVLSDKLDPQAKVIWGARIDEDMKGSVGVLLIVTGVHPKSPMLSGFRVADGANNGNVKKNHKRIGMDERSFSFNNASGGAKSISRGSEDKTKRLR